MSETTPADDDDAIPAPPAEDKPTMPVPEYGQIPAPGTAPDGRRYTEWLSRVLAFLIDAVPLVILVGIGSFFTQVLTTTAEVTHHGNLDGASYAYTTTETSVSAMGLLLSWVFYLVALAYWFWNKGFREGTTGKSIGKQITGHTTLHEGSNEPLGAGMGLLRLILLWVDFAICYIGVLWPLWDPKRQCLLSDRMTKAVVYKD